MGQRCMSSSFPVVWATVLTLVTWTISAIRLWKERVTISRRDVTRTVIGNLLIALVFYWFAYGNVIVSGLLYPGHVIIKNSREDSVVNTMVFVGAGVLMLLYLAWQRYGLRKVDGARTSS